MTGTSGGDLDVIQRREPDYAASADLLSRIAEGELRGSIAGHALTTIDYVVSRFAGRASADEAVDWILGDLEVVPESRDIFLRARSLGLEDFEGAVVAAAAEQTRSDRIVTRNVDDFEQSPVRACARSPPSSHSPSWGLFRRRTVRNAAGKGCQPSCTAQA